MKWVLGLAIVGLLAMAGAAGAASLIDGGDVKNSSLTGKDVRNRSLTQSDFRGSVRGPRGPQGPQGPAGVMSTSGITVVTAEAAVPAGGFGSAIAFCPAGQRVVSGGGFANNGGVDGLAASEPNDASTAWFTIMADNTGFGGTIQADALCATAGAAVISKTQSREATRREVARLVAQIEARR